MTISKTRHLTIIGIGISIVWGLVITVILFLEWETGYSMDLNEWGDFLAGVSAPLALFWLVIGYFQQGKELQLNTQALKAQKEELQRQVVETSRLAESAKRQASASESLASHSISKSKKEEQERKKKAQPIFISNGGSTSHGLMTTKVLNKGGVIHDVVLKYDGLQEMKLSIGKFWESGAEAIISLSQQQGTKLEWPMNFCITYFDDFEDEHTVFLEFIEVHKLQEKSS